MTDQGLDRTPKAAPLTGRQVRDLVAVLCLVVGAVSAGAGLWAIRPAAAVAVAGLTLIVVGVLLGMDRDGERDRL